MFEHITFKDDRWFDLEDLPNEEWRDIQGYERIYQISNYGRVKRIDHIKYIRLTLPDGKHKTVPHMYEAMILNMSYDRWGYVQVHLNNKGKVWKKVHRLVGEAFLPNPNNLEQINHINGCKEDNIIYNLEWVSRSENQKHAIRTGLRKLVYTNIGQYDLDGSLIRIYPNLTAASNELQIPRDCLYSAIKGYQKTCAGYLWKIVEDVD